MNCQIVKDTGRTVLWIYSDTDMLNGYRIDADKSEGTIKYEEVVDGNATTLFQTASKSDLEKGICTISGEYATDLPSTIVNLWDSFPKGGPFIACLKANGEHICFGYIYSSGSYGQVLGGILSDGSLYKVCCYNGSFTKYKLTGNSIN